MNGFSSVVEAISIFSAISSFIFWLASYQIKIGLQNKIEKLMIIITSRMQRQQDRNKTQIGIVSAEIEQIKSILNGKPVCVDLTRIYEALPEEPTDFSN
ncbi:hypothetical protein QUB63_22555 [Microcoleus sp. ARI1-B5]|uniref:hypothetical protein n=1 Tax=unclassified Microcoleus TaxID=2642155 RepID=UPI002FCEA9FC